MATPAEAAAKICAAIESVSLKPLSSPARDRVAEWTTGTTPHGADRAELLATREGEIHLDLLVRLIKNRCGPMVNGSLHVHDSQELAPAHIAALDVVLAISGTFLCNGPPPIVDPEATA